MDLDRTSGKIYGPKIKFTLSRRTSSCRQIRSVVRWPAVRIKNNDPSLKKHHQFTTNTRWNIFKNHQILLELSRPPRGSLPAAAGRSPGRCAELSGLAFINAEKLVLHIPTPARSSSARPPLSTPSICICKYTRPATVCAAHQHLLWPLLASGCV